MMNMASSGFNHFFVTISEVNKNEISFDMQAFDRKSMEIFLNSFINAKFQRESHKGIKSISCLPSMMQLYKMNSRIKYDIKVLTGVASIPSMTPNLFMRFI